MLIRARGPNFEHIASAPFITNTKMSRPRQISEIAHSLLDQGREEVEAHLAHINAELRAEEQHLKDLAAQLSCSHRTAMVMGSAGSITGGVGVAIAADLPIAGFTIAMLGTAASLISGTIIKYCSRTSFQHYYALKNIRELNSERAKFNDYLAQPGFLETAYRCYQTHLDLNSSGDSFIHFLGNKRNIYIIKHHNDEPIKKGAAEIEISS